MELRLGTRFELEVHKTNKENLANECYMRVVNLELVGVILRVSGV